MALDTTLLQVMKHRKYYDKLHRTVNDRAVDPRTKVILKDFGKYFAQAEECRTIPVETDFFTWFTMVAHRSLSDDDVAIYRSMFKEVSKEPAKESRDMLASSLLEADLAVQLSDAVQAYDDEQEIDLAAVLRRAIDQFELDTERKVKLPVVEASDDLFDDDTCNSGFRWRWPGLNMCMRPLRPGDFGILAGRPDKGKTSALADNVTYMATQMDEVYGKGHGRSILWLNNEGPGNRILKRCVQTALGVPTSELVKLQQAGEVWKRYEEAIQGDKTLIKVLNIHGMKFWQVEEIMRQLKPGLVIFDMIDNVNFDGSVINGGQRTDQLLEGMYQATRELSVRFDCPMIATSQISVEGDGMSYPTQSMLKDSKTGKQGAADFIITVGARNEPGMETVRFIGLTKNKLHLEGQPQSPKSEMIFEGATGRYYEAQ